MPRIQVYLPEDLYQELKSQKLPASALLQEAVRRHMRRQDIEAETDRYLAELESEIGQPSQAELDEARAFVESIVRNSRTQKAS